MTASKAKPKGNSKNGSVRKDYPNPRTELEDAYRRLGVTKEQMAEVVLIRPLLKQAGVTMAQVVDTLSSDASPEAQGFMAVYRRMSGKDRRRAPIEAIALAAGLSTRRLWEVISGASMIQGRDVVRLMLSAAQPAIVAKSIRGAKTEKGYIDRDHLYRAVGFFPTSKGAQVFVNVGKPVEEEREKESEKDSDGTGSLPKMDDYLIDIQRAISPATKSLPAPVPKIDTAEFVDLPPGELE